MLFKKHIVALVLCSLLFVPALAQQSRTSRIEESLTIFNDVLRQLDMNYVDTLNYESISETAINNALYKVDPYTIYYPKKKDDDLRMLTTGKYGGIGAIIQQRDSQVIIANPYEGKPAQRNDVLAGDVLISVDGTSVQGKKVPDVSQLLRGEPGSIVKLELNRDGQIITREFAREDIHLEPVDYYTTLHIDSTNQTFGYISFREFTEGSANEFSQSLNDLMTNHHISGLVFDLRGNGGGIIEEAIRIVSLFVPKGTLIVSTKGKIRTANNTYVTQVEPTYPDLPLVVLVDKNSASASEIVSGSLQDLKRATLIGQRTFGKGLVQNLRPIVYGGHLKVTTSKYYLPSGRCIQAIDYAEMQRGNKLTKDTAGGILPDIVLNDSAKVDITYTLYTKNMFFDYSVKYHREHDRITRPTEYEVSDSTMADFNHFLESNNFTYETETSKYFHDMLKMAEMEDIDSSTIAALKEIEPRLKPSFQEAIQRNLDEVKEYLGAELMERYYFQQGRTAYMLRFDKELKRAVQELSSNDKNRTRN